MGFSCGEGPPFSPLVLSFLERAEVVWAGCDAAPLFLRFLGALQVRESALWLDGRPRSAHTGQFTGCAQSRAICPGFPHL